MPKTTKFRPRLTCWITVPELKLAKAAAKRNGFRTASAWFAAMVRTRLAELK